jgi:hypothetical protein
MTKDVSDAELMHQLDAARYQAEEEFEKGQLGHVKISDRELRKVQKIFVRNFPEDEFDEEIMRRELVVQKRAQQIFLGQTLPRAKGPSVAISPTGALACPKCSGTHVTAQKQGFGAGKAIVGAALTGGVGLLAGFLGSRKVRITCLQCGHSWKAGS